MGAWLVFKCYGHKLSKRARDDNGRPSPLEFGFFLTARTPRRFSAAIVLRSEDDNQIPTPEGAGRRSLFTGRGHRCPEPREGADGHVTGKGRI